MFSCLDGVAVQIIIIAWVDVQLEEVRICKKAASTDRRYRQIRWHHEQSARWDEMREISALRFQLHLLGKSAPQTACVGTAVFLFLHDETTWSSVFCGADTGLICLMCFCSTLFFSEQQPPDRWCSYLLSFIYLVLLTEELRSDADIAIVKTSLYSCTVLFVVSFQPWIIWSIMIFI